MKKTIAKILSVTLVLMLLVSAAALPAAAAENEYVCGMGLVASDWSTSTDFGASSSVQTTVTGDGTYTLSYDGACADIGILVVDIIGAQADLGANGQTYELTGLTLTIDGAEVAVDQAKVLSGDLEENGNYRIDLYNMYGDSSADPSLDNTLAVAENLTLTFTIQTVEMAAESGEAAALPEEYDLFIAYGGDKEAENDWGWGYTGSDVEGITAVTSKIKVGETATVSLTFDTPTVNSWYFAPCLVAENVTGIGAVDFTVTCKIDGEEVAVDMAADEEGKTWWVEDTGDYTKESCIRLAGGYNEWATKYIEEPASFTTIEYTITLNAVSSTAETPVEEAEPAAAEIDLNGTYNVYLMLQTPNWTYRDAWNADNGIGSDYFGDFIYGNETSEKYGVVTDAVIAGNGTYTVSVTDFGTIFSDDFTTAGQDYFNIIGLSTDIPLNDSVQITDVKLIIDGSTRHTYKEAFLDPDETEYMKVLIQNIWNENVKEISYYPAPSTSLEIQFTVSGFAYDNADQAVEETEAAPTEPVAEAAAEGGSMTGIIIAVVAVVAVAAVVVVVMKKKKAA